MVAPLAPTGSRPYAWPVEVETGRAPLVSVIVPVFNGQDTIETAVRSVLEQAGAEVECIVVDDASADATPTALAALAAADERVISIRSPVNEGASAARNRALAVARGAWIGFLDADDVLLPGALPAMIEAGTRADALAVVGQRISSDGTRTWFPRSYDIPDIRTSGVKSMVTHPGLLYYVGPAGKLFRRDIVTGMRFAGRMLGDQPWIIEALLRAGDRIMVIDNVVYEWRRPRDHGDFSTITAARVRSARLAAEATRMAADTYSRVSALLDRYVAPEHRRRLRVTYVERLVQADLEAQLHSALERTDPSLSELFMELEGFLRTVESDVVRSVNVIEPSLLVPAARRLNRLALPARDAFWSLLRAAADLRVGSDAPSPGWRRLRMIMALPGPLQRPIGEPALRLPPIVSRADRRSR